MTTALFQFGELHPDYTVPVLNERAVRASAGMLFLVGLVAFMNAWLVGNFALTRVFVLLFLVDFSVRILVNPRYSPTLIVGQWVVRQQQPEWVGAPQKRFAWAIGWALALIMVYLVVIHRVIGPVNLIVCSLCLTLMFFESAFGICLGCKVYNAFNAKPAQHCPGGTCERPLTDRPQVSAVQLASVAVFAGLVVVVWQAMGHSAVDAARNDHAGAASLAAPASPNATAMDPAEVARCKVPDFAKAMGHEAQWKLHNNCQ